MEYQRQKGLEKRHVDGPIRVGTKGEHFISHTNAHQKGPTTEEALQYQVDKMSQLGNNCSLCSWAGQGSYTMVAVKEAIRGPNSMGSLSCGLAIQPAHNKGLH